MHNHHFSLYINLCKRVVSACSINTFIIRDVVLVLRCSRMASQTTIISLGCHMLGVVQYIQYTGISN